MYTLFVADRATQARVCPIFLSFFPASLKKPVPVSPDGLNLA
jgi:hypothetical protein